MRSIVDSIAERPSMGAMMTSCKAFIVPSRNRMAHLMMLLFAFQVVASGVCLMIPQAQATPMAHAMVISSHALGGGIPDDMDNASHDCGHGHCNANFHCDQPDLSVSNAMPLVSTPLAAAVWVAILSVNLSPQPLLPSLRLARVPTGPPRSASLLYTTSQRLRI
ncbi:MAG: hypothetical protein Q9M26_08720 [Mariprofundales bacterium]|nr:hypothetical protein [Mariprofundales bacterium]